MAIVLFWSINAQIKNERFPELIFRENKTRVGLTQYFEGLSLCLPAKLSKVDGNEFTQIEKGL